MYYVTYAIFYIISLLPFRVLHWISDVFYIIVYYIIGYRRQIVMSNLGIAFPEKTLKEREKIARKFYRNLIDTFLEMLKVISISEKSIHKRFKANYEVINDLFASGQNVHIHSGHFFNWELSNFAFADKLKYNFLGAYMPLKNKMFNKLLIDLRSRFGTKLIAATNFKNEFNEHNKQQYCIGLVGDQNPGAPPKAFWASFFGRRTPFITGLEKGARNNNAAVVFCHFYPVKRGYYQADLKLITKDPLSLQEGELTLLFVRFMEESIRKRPDNYLWSHRRWKHQWKDEYGEMWIDG